MSEKYKQHSTSKGRGSTYYEGGSPCEEYHAQGLTGGTRAHTHTRLTFFSFPFLIAVQRGGGGERPRSVPDCATLLLYINVYHRIDSGFFCPLCQKLRAEENWDFGETQGKIRRNSGFRLFIPSVYYIRLLRNSDFLWNPWFFRKKLRIFGSKLRFSAIFKSGVGKKVGKKKSLA